MKALAALALLLGLVACSGSDDGDRAGGDASDAAPTSPFSPEDSGPATDDVDLASTEVCDLVRKGIDEFNLGDLGGTIERFEAAVPEAEALASEEPSDKTRTLLDAVRYYAELPADEYVAASRTSSEFLKFKEFTLTECDYTVPPDGATDPGIPA